MLSGFVGADDLFQLPGLVGKFKLDLDRVALGLVGRSDIVAQICVLLLGHSEGRGAVVDILIEFGFEAVVVGFVVFGALCVEKLHGLVGLLELGELLQRLLVVLRGV